MKSATYWIPDLISLYWELGRSQAVQWLPMELLFCLNCSLSLYFVGSTRWLDLWSSEIDAKHTWKKFFLPKQEKHKSFPISSVNICGRRVDIIFTEDEEQRRARLIMQMTLTVEAELDNMPSRLKWVWRRKWAWQEVVKWKWTNKCSALWIWSKARCNHWKDSHQF